MEWPLASNPSFSICSVMAPASPTGTVCVYSSALSHVIVDTSGYIESNDVGGFVASTPTLSIPATGRGHGSNDG